MMVPGGLSETRCTTPEIQKIVDEVKPQFEEKTKEKYDCFKAVQYKRQTVAGTIYYVKVHLGCERYAHLEILEPLPQNNETIQLLKYQTGKTKDDEVSSL